MSVTTLHARSVGRLKQEAVRMKHTADGLRDTMGEATFADAATTGRPQH